MASASRHYDWLMDWDFFYYDPVADALSTNTYYYSRYGTRTVGGHTYVPRIESISDLTLMYIDRKKADFSSATVKLCNLADDMSANFPFHALDALADFEDKRIRIYLYDVVADTKTLVWHGFTKRPNFDPAEFTCEITGSFFWDAADIKLPAMKLVSRCPYAFGGDRVAIQGDTANRSGCTYNGSTKGTPGFTSCGHSLSDCTARGMQTDFGGFTHIAPVLKDDINNLIDKSKVRDGVVPLIYCDTEFKVKPECYRAVVKDGELTVNFLISGCHPTLPFDNGDLSADKIRLSDGTKAYSLTWFRGIVDQPVPTSRTLFPEKAGHSLVAYGCARFKLTEDQKQRYKDSAAYHELTLKMAKGRKTLRSSAATANPVYVLEDIFRDKLFGMGIPSTDLDLTAISIAAAYNASRFSGRFEIDKEMPLIDLVQNFLGTFHGYVTFNGGLMQIGVKRDDETAVATFGTGGVDIIDNNVTWTETDYADLVNKYKMKYRDIHRKPRFIEFQDYGAQRKAGNGLVKQVEQETFLQGIYDETQALISGACLLREELNLNGIIQFEVDLGDFLATAARPGKVIRVNNIGIVNNGTNYLFRVESCPIDEENYSVTVNASLYATVAYSYSAEALGSDIVRVGGTTTTGARPPQVTGQSIAIVDMTSADDDHPSKVRCLAQWTNPPWASEISEANTEDIYPEYPLEGVLLMGRYDDDKDLEFKPLKRVKYPHSQAHFLIDHHRLRHFETWFISLGRSGSHGFLGFEADGTRADQLTSAPSSTQITYVLGSVAAFAADDYVQCGDEINRVLSIAGTTLTLYNMAGTRTSYFDTVGVGHSIGDDVAVAVRTHPIATLDMTANRYTLPVVQNVTVRTHRHGVHIDFDKLDLDHVHYIAFFTFGSNLNNATTYVANWGTSSDPRTPPSGTTETGRMKKHSFQIHHAVLDAAFGGNASGILPKVRVVAVMRNNWSSAMSALATGVGHSHGPNVAPATPNAGTDFIYNGKDDDPTTNKARVRVRIRTAGSVSMATAEATHVHAIFAPYNAGVLETDPTKYLHYHARVADPTLAYQDVEFDKHFGKRLLWIESRLSNDGGHTSAAGSIDFRAGLRTSDTASVTLFQVVSVVTTDDGKHAKATLSYRNAWNGTTNTGDPASILHVEIYESVGITDPGTDPTTDTTNWVIENERSTTHDDTYSTNGLKTFYFRVKHPQGVRRYYRGVLRLVGGGYVVTASVFNDAAAEASGGDTGPPNWSFTPSIGLTYESGKLHLFITPPDINSDSIFRAWWAIESDLGHYMTDIGTDFGTGRYNFSSHGTDKMINLKKKNISASFLPPRTVRLHGYLENKVSGVITPSADKIGSFVSLTDRDSMGTPDSRAPAPTVLGCHIGNHGFAAHCTGTTDVRSNCKVEWQFRSTASGTAPHMDPETGQSTGSFAVTLDNVAAAAGSVYDGDINVKTWIRRANLAASFKVAGNDGQQQNLYARCRFIDMDASGNVRYGFWSGFVQCVFNATTDEIPVKHHGHAGGNLVEGSFMFSGADLATSGGVANRPAVDVRYNTTLSGAGSGPVSGVLLNDTVTAVNGTAYWDSANHCIKVTGNGTGIRIFFRVGRLAILGKYTWSFKVAGSLGATLSTVGVALYNNNATTAIATSSLFASVSLPQFGSAAYKMLGGKLSGSNYTGTENVFIGILINAGAAQNVYIDDLALYFGNDVKSYSPGPKEGSGDTNRTINSVFSHTSFVGPVGFGSDSLADGQGAEITLS